MSESRADFKRRLSRLPKRQVSHNHDPILDARNLGSTLAPLSYPFSGVIGFLMFLILPRLFHIGGAEDGTRDWALEAIWIFPSLGLAFAGSVVFLSIMGLTTGAHLKSTTLGIGLAFALVRFLAGLA